MPTWDERIATVLANDDLEVQHSDRDDLYIRFIDAIAEADLEVVSPLATNLLTISGCAAWFA